MPQRQSQDERTPARRRSPLPLGTLAVAWLLSGLPGAARSDWLIATDARWRHDDNVGNAQSADDIVADSITAATLTASQSLVLDDRYSLDLGGTLGGESYARLHGLDNATLGAIFSVRRKWGLGAFTPWAKISLSAAHTDYDDSYRDAAVYRAALAAGQRLDQRWAISFEYAFERRHAGAQEQQEPGISGDAFSQRSHTVTLSAQCTTSEHTSLTAGLIARRGDVVSTTLDDGGPYAAPRAVADDPAFGDDAYAYRVVANTVGVRAAVHYAPALHHSFGLGFTRWETYLGGDQRYTKSIPEVTWDYRF